jgi:hypothetical protein
MVVIRGCSEEQVVLCVLVLGPDEVMQGNAKGRGEWEDPRAGMCWSCLIESKMFGMAELKEPDGT